MNKTNTTNSTLNMIKSVCAERDRKEHDRLWANRLEMDKRDEAEKERLQHSNESMRRRSEDANRTKEMTSAINRGIRNAEKKEEDSKSWDAFKDRNRRLLDKGIEAVKRERNRTYFS